MTRRRGVRPNIEDRVAEGIAAMRSLLGPEHPLHVVHCDIDDERPDWRRGAGVGPVFIATGVEQTEYGLHVVGRWCDGSVPGRDVDYEQTDRDGLTVHEDAEEAAPPDVDDDDLAVHGPPGNVILSVVPTGVEHTELGPVVTGWRQIYPVQENDGE